STISDQRAITNKSSESPDFIKQPRICSQVESAVDNMYPDFRATDNHVTRNTSRVLKAFQNARVGSHVCHNVIITLIYRHYHIIMFVAYFAQQLLISCFIMRTFM
ncbi:hypothetical protein M8C21_002017, partial [Ambrosia artemisiifolia]